MSIVPLSFCHAPTSFTGFVSLPAVARRRASPSETHAVAAASGQTTLSLWPQALTPPCHRHVAVAQRSGLTPPIANLIFCESTGVPQGDPGGPLPFRQGGIHPGQGLQERGALVSLVGRVVRRLFHVFSGICCAPEPRFILLTKGDARHRRHAMRPF